MESAVGRSPKIGVGRQVEGGYGVREFKSLRLGVSYLKYKMVPLSDSHWWERARNWGVTPFCPVVTYLLCAGLCAQDCASYT